jgi:fumarylacetoacetate (FAA) hydrolase
MKLASIKDGSRDGQLIVVSRDLRYAHYATGTAQRLQQVLDDWNFMAPQLQDLSDSLNQGKARHAFPFDPVQCMAPLPRAYQRCDASAYPVATTGAARTTRGDQNVSMEALLRQASSDDLLGPCDDFLCDSASQGIDFDAELAVVCADLAQGATPEQALDGIRLVMLANALHLRLLKPADAGPGASFLQSQPATAFSPVAVTLDELGEAWDRGRLNLGLQVTWNGRRVGMCEAGEMRFHFGQLLAHLCQTRRVRAGTIIGSGTVRNQDPSRGYASIAQRRAVETQQDGQPSTGFMQLGDSIRIEMKAGDGSSLFGAIEQKIAARD